MKSKTIVWAPSDKSLTVEEQKVLSLQVSPTQEITKTSLLRMLMADKLAELMDQTVDVEAALAIVPDLLSVMNLGLNHKATAEMWMEESSLADLINQVDLKAPSRPTLPEVELAHQSQTLESLLESLYESLTSTWGGNISSLTCSDNLADMGATQDSNEGLQPFNPHPVYDNDVEPKVKPSGNTISTDECDAEAVINSILGGGTIDSSAPPEFVLAGITLSFHLIEKGERTFSQYAEAMIWRMGDMVLPYLKSWYMAVKYDPSTRDMKKMSSFC